jgi:uncharacterized protein
MTNSVTHFEIYGEEPAKLADFYRDIFGWHVDQMPGVNYWRIQIDSVQHKALHGGLTYRAIPDLNGWLLFVNVPSVDDTVALVQKLGGSIVRPKTAVPKTAWVTILTDPAKNIFGVWQADPNAFPLPEPH